MKNFSTYLIILFVVWVIMTGRLPAFINVISTQRWNFSSSLFPAVFSGSGGGAGGMSPSGGSGDSGGSGLGEIEGDFGGGNGGLSIGTVAEGAALLG